MVDFPINSKKIRERIGRYERALEKEFQRFGCYDDSHGKRFWLGTLYLILGDNDATLKHFGWYERVFHDQAAEPTQYLSWTIALYRDGQLEAAIGKLIQTMLSNLYIIPHLMGEDIDRFDIHVRAETFGFTNGEPDYLINVPEALWMICSDEEIGWFKSQYESFRVRGARAKFLGIERRLKNEPRGPMRTSLVEEVYRLKKLEF